MHNIYKDKFYAHREAAWHGLGYVSQVPTSAWDAAMLVGLPAVFTEPIQTKTGIMIPNYKAICGRDRENSVQVYSVVSEDYHEITHGDFVRSWDRVTNNTPVETLGLLGNGSTLFLTAQLPGFDVKGVEHKNYLLAVNPLSGHEAEYGRVTPVRVVCQNTLNLSGGRFVEEFRARHTGDVLLNLDKWLQDVWDSARFKSEALQEAFNVLASRKVTETEAKGIIAPAYPFLVTSEKADVYELAEASKVSQTQRDHREAVYNLFEGRGRGASYPDVFGTAYGAYNAVVEYEQHGKKYGKASSNFVGAGARRTGAALDAALVLVRV